MDCKSHPYRAPVLPVRCVESDTGICNLTDRFLSTWLSIPSDTRSSFDCGGAIVWKTRYYIPCSTRNWTCWELNGMWTTFLHTPRRTFRFHNSLITFSRNTHWTLQLSTLIRIPKSWIRFSVRKQTLCLGFFIDFNPPRQIPRPYLKWEVVGRINHLLYSDTIRNA